ncbi:MAG: hypothetical protein ACFFCF_06015 [Promethearchaeota archaeon]
MDRIVELYPGFNRVWRVGFIILTIAIISLFVSQLVLFELVRQAMLQSVWWLASPNSFFNFILIVSITVLIGAWYSMIVVFGCTHPKHPKYGEWVTNGLLVATFVSLCWGEFIQYFHWANLMPPPDWGILNILVANSIIFTIIGFFIAIQSIVVWWKWLNPRPLK